MLVFFKSVHHPNSSASIQLLLSNNWLESFFFSVFSMPDITESINNCINPTEQTVSWQGVEMSLGKGLELFMLSTLFSFKKNRMGFRGFSFCVEQRPLRTQSVSMLSSLQNSGRKSMRKKKRKTRRCVTPYSG